MLAMWYLGLESRCLSLGLESRCLSLGLGLETWCLVNITARKYDNYSGKKNWKILS